jgi:putative FmdB family regulatory protein
MPLYEYECDACGHRFERIQKFSDPLETKCPACGGAVHKLMSSPAIQFKGSGWYITDYAKKDGNKDQKTGSKDTSDTKADATESKDAVAGASDGKASKPAADAGGETKSTKPSDTKSSAKTT